VIKAVEEKEASKASLLVQGHVYKFNRLMEKRARKERGRPKKGEGVL
jgi:hypothetical protein